MNVVGHFSMHISLRSKLAKGNVQKKDSFLQCFYNMYLWYHKCMYLQVKCKHLLCFHLRFKDLHWKLKEDWAFQQQNMLILPTTYYKNTVSSRMVLLSNFSSKESRYSLIQLFIRKNSIFFLVFFLLQNWMDL